MPPDSVPQPQAIQAGWRERLSLLRVSDFRKIWLAGGLYGTVRWLDMLAVGVFTYEVTNSPLIVAFMVFLRLLPLILMGTVIGALAERFIAGACSSAVSSSCRLSARYLGFWL